MGGGGGGGDSGVKSLACEANIKAGRRAGSPSHPALTVSCTYILIIIRWSPVDHLSYVGGIQPHCMQRQRLQKLTGGIQLDW